jgi:hypothetical protein
MTPDQLDRGLMARASWRDLQCNEVRSRDRCGWRLMRDSMRAGLCHAAVDGTGTAHSAQQGQAIT